MNGLLCSVCVCVCERERESFSLFLAAHREDKRRIALPCLVVPVLFGEVQCIPRASGIL